MSKRKAVFFLLIAAVLWSTGGILIKLILLNSMAIAGIRSVIAALCFGIFCHPLRLSFSATQVGAAIAYASCVFFFVVSIRLTTAANTAFLQYTAPIYVAFFSAWFLGEKVRRLDWLSILVVFFGIFLFFLDRLNPAGFWGSIFALISGMSLAWVTLFLRKQKDSSPLESIFLGNIFCALVCLPFMFESLPSAKDWGFLVVLGVFQLALPYFLFSHALKKVSAVEGILIPVIAPILNPCWVFFFLGEVPGKGAVVGGVIVLSTVIIRSLMMVKEERKNEKHFRAELKSLEA